jgi:lipopolysaccharide/colanic/teichoic acid biosynthesis glycosyltransferase
MTYAFYHRFFYRMSIAMRLANRTPTVQNSVCSRTDGPAIAINDWEFVFLFSRAAKRAFDIVAASIGLILFSPMFALVSIAIKLDSRGPVFHRHVLHRYNNENIQLLKFRTTIICGQSKALQYVTRVGGVLRRTGVDGLPQLINVLRGEMSIVGPAPYAAALNNIFAEQVSLIRLGHRAKPGITGWAQVNGCRGESDKMMRQRLEFDQHYIENWSFFFDIRILLLTLFSKDAYLN